MSHYPKSFSIARIPRILFGVGVINQLPEIISSFTTDDSHVLLLTGANSFDNADWSTEVLSGLAKSSFTVLHAKANGGEPSPDSVDGFVKEFKDKNIKVVVAIGGGSIMDEAKAIAGLLGSGDSVMDYLEGVGPEKTYSDNSVPFIAVPTTAGTGSEATKNAVLSRHGGDGFKKSFRDDALVAEWAIVDPDLIASCPPEILAGNGMDALTQLMESYVSLNANPMTDALALEGIKAVKAGLIPLFKSKGQDANARECMAFASLQSGVCLAQTGLGSVHGLAAPLGAFFPIPHGIVCGTLLAAATKINIDALKLRAASNDHALDKYAHLARVMTGKVFDNQNGAHQALIALLEKWTEDLQLPRLKGLGIHSNDFDNIVKNSRGSSMKTNPIMLTDDEVLQILKNRM